MPKTVKVPNAVYMQGEITLQAASADEDKGDKGFTLLAYSGGKLNLAQHPYPVVVDLEGLKVPSQKVPTLADHQRELKQTVGHTTTIDASGGELVATGVFSGSNEASAMVLSQLESGLPLQASIGVRYAVGDAGLVTEGDKASVNGQEFEGPVIVVAHGVLEEISFCPLGADSNSNAALLAASTQVELQAMSKETGGEKTPAPVKEVTSNKGTAVIEASAKAEASLRASRAVAAEEAERTAAIASICATAGNPRLDAKGEGDDEPGELLQAHAIVNGWDAEKVELYAERLSRPKAPASHSTPALLKEQVVEASLARQVINDEDYLVGKYGEQVLEAASSPNVRGMSICRLMHETVQATGGYVPANTRGDALIKAYNESSRSIQAASGNTGHNLVGILSNVGHKAAEQAFQSAETSWRDIASVASHTDFKVHTRYRLTSGLTYQRVGKEGELKTGPLHEDSYTNQIDTYGGLVQLTRQDIINDDLGLFSSLPTQLGTEAAAFIDEQVYTALVGAPTGFFATADAADRNGNHLTSNAFGYDALSAAEQVFLDQIKPGGRPISVSPSVLLVPTALKAEAERLMKSSTILPAEMEGDTNIHANKFSIVCSPFLSRVPAGDNTTWYLLANPARSSTVEVAFLNGMQSPTIETDEAAFNILGTQWRFYHDVGVSTHEPRAAVKCTA